MGSVFRKEEKKEEKKPKDLVFDHTRIYYDHDGNLRYGESTRDRDAELMRLLALDDYDETDPNRIWFIIPNPWVRHWLKFAKFRMGEAPGPCDNTVLLHKNEDGSWRPKKTLKPPTYDYPGHFRRVPRAMWDAICELYPGSGPVIAVWGPPAHDTSRWRVFENVADANETNLPKPEIAEEKEGEETKEEGGKKKMFGLF